MALAISLYSAWNRCRSGDIVQAVNKARIPSSFMDIRNALHGTLVTTLVKLFDQSLTNASFRTVIADLKKGAPSKELTRIEQHVQSVEQDSRFKALLRHRHTVLAHRAAKVRSSGAMFGDEGWLLKESKQIAHDLEWLARGNHANLDSHEKARNQEADRFWSKIASA
ncbi:MAG: hypothetical protein JNL04_10865, partial [Rhodospirillaceae bacterium]|nr:hypothetical protein [Rhodospirillaceae bacterium]